MRNFILGVLTTFGGLALCKKMYDNGYDDAVKEIKKDDKKDSSKKKAK